MHLVIVESPTKARKLKTYLGSDYKVEASVGHVRDLPTSQLGIEIEKDFKPVYEVPADKQKIVTKLHKLAQQSDKIYLAMDPDREGEAIAWHLRKLLTEPLVLAADEKGKAKKSSKKLKTAADFLRSTFHEITKPMVLAAIEKPGKINQDLFYAQQARRVMDRLVGYQVSPVLWRKVRRGLSAGRVQSVALRLVVEREREIEAFKAEEYWEIAVGLWADGHAKQAKLFKDGKPVDELPANALVVNLEKVNGKKFGAHSETQVKPIVSDLKAASYQITAVDRQERQRQSLPPFITASLQQAAANKFGWSAKQTMAVAQQLYEEGLITYHRTDSFNLAKSAMEKARKVIGEKFGPEYLPAAPRFFKRKAKNAQEAHEAIRVTKPGLMAEEIRQEASGLNERHVKLYDLVWRRFVASQMAAAVYDQTTVEVEAKRAKQTYLLRATGSVIKFAGWTKLFKPHQDIFLPELMVGQEPKFAEINPVQKFTQPLPRYNDASLIKELEKRGIGRPSTYASIISVIVNRAYVERREKRFFATQVGMAVCDFLTKNFPEIMNYDFTAEMEEDLDEISLGHKEWQKVVKTFYSPLGKKIKTVIDKAKRVQIPVEKTGEKCPDCGKTENGEIVIRTGRFGKFKSCSRFPDCKFTQNLVETVPNVKCPLCQEGKVIMRKTRWGKNFYGCQRYPECNWASWREPKPGEKVTAKAWAEYQKKREERKKKREATMLAKKQRGAKPIKSAQT